MRGPSQPRSSDCTCGLRNHALRTVSAPLEFSARTHTNFQFFQFQIHPNQVEILSLIRSEPRQRSHIRFRLRHGSSDTSAVTLIPPMSYAGRDGNVYRKTESGSWEQSNGSGGWSPATGADRPSQQPSGGADRPSQTPSASTRPANTSNSAG